MMVACGCSSGAGSGIPLTHAETIQLWLVMLACVAIPILLLNLPALIGRYRSARADSHRAPEGNWLIDWSDDLCGVDCPAPGTAPSIHASVRAASERAQPDRLRDAIDPDDLATFPVEWTQEFAPSHRTFVRASSHFTNFS
ncbi:MAG: hypothetical protein KDC46_08240 [Thermoleophilia bacterium]|nr:hypothetical protein [Thermoleophilia bacterium]